MYTSLTNKTERFETEKRILAAALAQSYVSDDANGIELAHQQILGLLQSKSQKIFNLHELELGSPAGFQGFYDTLNVSHLSSLNFIHKRFLSRARVLLANLQNISEEESAPLLQELHQLWIAHDILTDPITRADYDFRQLNIMSGGEEDTKNDSLNKTVPLRLGELLRCAGLLEQIDHEVSCDMHKAVPDLQFGQFLVSHGFLTEPDLHSVLFAQTLLRAGIITVLQYQIAMELAHSRGIGIEIVLIERGYIEPEWLYRSPIFAEQENTSSESHSEIAATSENDSQESIEANGDPKNNPFYIMLQKTKALKAMQNALPESSIAGTP